MNIVQLAQFRRCLIIPLAALTLCLNLVSPSQVFADLCSSLRETGTEPLIPLIETAVERSRVHRRQVERALQRAHRSAWFPEVSVYARHGQAEDSSLRPSGMGLSSDREFRVGVELHFDLRRILHSRQTAVLLRQSANAMRAEQSLTEQIIELVFHRLELTCLSAESSDLPPQDLLRRLELDTNLDALTAGAWSQLVQSEERVDMQVTRDLRTSPNAEGDISSDH